VQSPRRWLVALAFARCSPRVVLPASSPWRLPSAQAERLELFVGEMIKPVQKSLPQRTQRGWSRWLSHGASTTVWADGTPSVFPSEDVLMTFVVGTRLTLVATAGNRSHAAWSPWFSHGTPPGLHYCRHDHE